MPLTTRRRTRVGLVAGTALLAVGLPGCSLLGGDDADPPQPAVVAPSDAPVPVATAPRLTAVPAPEPAPEPTPASPSAPEGVTSAPDDGSTIGG
ncbi:hypothetical protein [Aquipuribacter nitratireducens]|uniref:Uncharacterized protein n=1 Tax=Aquipuribacter nitratireducens TaxID=650104 RepID=A0ABW0GTB1_9MICO